MLEIVCEYWNTTTTCMAKGLYTNQIIRHNKSLFYQMHHPVYKNISLQYNCMFLKSSTFQVKRLHLQMPSAESTLKTKWNWRDLISPYMNWPHAWHQYRYNDTWKTKERCNNAATDPAVDPRIAYPSQRGRSSPQQILGPERWYQHRRWLHCISG